MLKGIPVLRDLWPFSKVPPFRGLANVRYLDFPAADEARLAAICGPGKATFITPNHPEFFTDWMIDKEVLARVSPLAAAWATTRRRQRPGRLAQKFWLANNLIAQIPGNSAAARAHSVAWASQGHGVLLHPEGGVGWHGDYVAPLMPGAVEMALEALGGRPQVEPAVPGLGRAGRVEAGLHERRREAAACRMCLCRALVEGRGRGIRSVAAATRLPHLRGAAGARRGTARIDRRRIPCPSPNGMAPSARRFPYSSPLCLALSRLPAATNCCAWRGESCATRPRSTATPPKLLRQIADALARVGRLGAFAFAGETITQEGIAEHLKRIRNDYCEGSLRDTLNRFVPQPAGPRRAHIRVPEPLGLHDFNGSEDDALALLRSPHAGRTRRAQCGNRTGAALPPLPEPVPSAAACGGLRLSPFIQAFD